MMQGVDEILDTLIYLTKEKEESIVYEERQDVLDYYEQQFPEELDQGIKEFAIEEEQKGNLNDKIQKELESLQEEYKSKEQSLVGLFYHVTTEEARISINSNNTLRAFPKKKDGIVVSRIDEQFPVSSLELVCIMENYPLFHHMVLKD
jgi:hypothetical protein